VSSADSGVGTLRWCLENAANGDIINFDSSVFTLRHPVTVRLESPLPSISQGNLTIDASNAGVILIGSGLCTSSAFKAQSDNGHFS